MASYDELCLWKRDRLVQFLRERGLSTTGRIDQLRALVYGAIQFGAPKKPTADEERRQKAQQYSSLLLVNGIHLPDPLTVLNTGWIGEQRGVSEWPPCMYGDISVYLIDRSERDLRTRLLTDYKEGKAFSYFDSKWLKELFYHPITAESQYCFLKADCTPSMNVQHGPHKVWICIGKKTGQIFSAYCSCFAGFPQRIVLGLGSTCNHVAAVLFKLDYAWQNGYTNRSCTSLPAEWTLPTKQNAEPMKIKDMEWRQPHYSKGGSQACINPRVRKLFSPVKSTCKSREPSLEGLMGAMFVSCSDASAFQYAIPAAKISYSVEDDINVTQEIEIETTVCVPQPLPELVASYKDKTIQRFPEFSLDQVNALESITRSQSDSHAWHQQRIGRITGSIAHSVLTKARKLKHGDPGNMDNVVSAIMRKKTVNPNLAPLKYGREMEPIARSKYEHILIQKGHRNVQVRECGLFVHPKHIFMAASPDAVIKCDCCGEGLLEIKYPFQIAHTLPEECPPAYLIHRGTDNELSLKTSHSYYTQVLMQLFVTSFTWCDFFVFTKHGYFLQRIDRGSHGAQLEELKEAASKVFADFILPQLSSTNIGYAEPHSPEPSTSSQPDFADPPGQFLPSTGSAQSDMLDEDSDASLYAHVAKVLGSPPKKKQRKGRAKGRDPQPFYICSVCQHVCKEVETIDNSQDNSVGCDSCFTWFHWGCVGFDGLDLDTWLCPSCSPDV